MEITKRLIEKYHLGECTPEEQTHVEAWLLNDDFKVPALPPEIDKEEEIAKIWNALEDELFAEEKPKALPLSPKRQWISSRKGSLAIACSLLIFFCSAVYLIIYKNNAVGSFALDNLSSTMPKAIDTRNYFVSVSPKTSAEINLDTGFAHISGSLLLQPKDDMQLAFNGHPEKINLINGNTYIVIGNEDDKPFIMNKKDLLHLPPIILQQIFSQLSI